MSGRDPDAPVVLPERAVTGSFCHWNCTQEALAGVLVSRWAADVQVMDHLSFMDLPAISRAAAAGRDPGDVGGVSLEQLTALYGIRLSRWAPHSPRALARRLVRLGPHLARVERSALPAGRAAHTRGGPHVLLVVGAVGDGVLYSDHSCPHRPSPLPWEAFTGALLPWPRQHASEAPVLAAVVEGRSPGAAVLARAAASFRARAIRALGTPAEAVHLALTELLRPGRARHHAVEDIAALLNGVCCSARAAARAFERCGRPRLGAFFEQHAGDVERLRRAVQVNALRGRPDAEAPARHQAAIVQRWRRGVA